MKVAIVFLLSFALLALPGCRKEAPAEPGGESTPAKAAAPAAEAAAVGSSLPPYKAQTLEGGEFDLASAKGTVVLLNIWATWCGPCRYEIPELIKLHQTYASRGFQVLGVSVDDEGTMSGVAPMVAERKINYPVVLDPKGTIADIFETNVIPTSALLDKQGKIVWKEIGTVHADDPKLVAAIEAALK